MSEYTEKDLVKIAKRENNTKRGYLVVNPLQGKHIPASPTEALMLFARLADTLKGKYKGERILFVGFAETATAIGAQVAISRNMPYIQTTRETIPDVNYFFFSETHSHATEQKLVKDDIDASIGEIDRIVFVEDEVTTGNTILHIIDLIRKEYGGRVKFSVASLLNGMEEAFLGTYREKGIGLHYLVKTDHGSYAAKAEAFRGDGDYFGADASAADGIIQYEIGGYLNARRVVEPQRYREACGYLADQVLNKLPVGAGASVLVLGTEEFMYPALFVGSVLERKGMKVRCHATTRSPILVGREEGYPLHERYELLSLYDKSRKTFIYDLAKYDKVLIVTDARLREKEGLYSLLNALKKYNSDIALFRWCEKGGAIPPAECQSSREDAI